MFHFNTYWGLIILLITSVMSCSSLDISKLKAAGYVINYGDNIESKKIGELAFQELEKRTAEGILLKNKKGKTPKGFKVVNLKVDSNAPHSYCIKHNSDEINLTTKDYKTGLWLVYQFIERLAKEDERFIASDLFPSYIHFSSHCKDFDFKYREPFYSLNVITELSDMMGTHSIDLDWGLWGHNLNKVTKDINDESIYAMVSGKRNQAQFDFSSTVLFETLSKYIIEEFGEGGSKSYNFVIMPNDNKIVCMCNVCAEIGNTTTDATPAVSAFIEKLALKFPKHTFFTSSYLTTTVPNSKLPQNTAVFLSTINLPSGIDLDEEQKSVKKFIEEIQEWKKITSNVYVWDYAANFDDYLSPIPVLYGLQKKLDFFKAHDIKGVFLNASGYDYSSFDDLKNYVAAALMIDRQQNIDSLCTLFFQKFYPSSQDLLTSYYLKLEKDFQNNGKAYNLYGGLNEIFNSYLNIDDFISFYNALEESIEQLEGEEKNKLEKLYTALSFTRLQLAYYSKSNSYGFVNNKDNKLTVKSEVKPLIKELEKHSNYDNMHAYKEFDGSLQQYINFWERTLSNKHLNNLILNKKLDILSPIDEGFENSTLLTDGIPAYEHDYHQGWYISSNDLHLVINTTDIKGNKEFNLKFLNAHRHGFYPPEKVEVFSNDNLIKTIDNTKQDEDSRVVEINFKLNLSKVDSIELNFVRKDIERSKIACDEIRIL